MSSQSVSSEVLSFMASLLARLQRRLRYYAFFPAPRKAAKIVEVISCFYVHIALTRAKKIKVLAVNPWADTKILLAREVGRAIPSWRREDMDHTYAER